MVINSTWHYSSTMLKRIIRYAALLLFCVFFGLWLTFHAAIKPIAKPLSTGTAPLDSSIDSMQLKPAISVKTRYGRSKYSEMLGLEQINETHFAELCARHPKGCLLEGPRHRRLAALTFDDGPSEYSLAIAEKLKQYNAKATFFWTGMAIQQNPEIAKEISAAGHSIGNHTLKHQHNADREPQELWSNSIEPTNTIIKTIIGSEPTAFRPSFGEISDEQIAFLNDKGITTVLWSLDTRDWLFLINTAEDIATTVNNHIHPEAIILMHDAGGYRKPTVDSLDKIIPYYQSQGFNFVTIEELLN